jgi:hypothetical protein
LLPEPAAASSDFLRDSAALKSPAFSTFKASAFNSACLAATAFSCSVSGALLGIGVGLFLANSSAATISAVLMG